MYGLHASDVSRLSLEATTLLRRNGAGHFTKPSNGQYPHQWNWDSALIAIGLRHTDPVRALAEIASLLRGQWDNGMVPHIVFHEPGGRYFPNADFWQADGRSVSGVATSGITQPPVLAVAVRQIVERMSLSADTAEFIRTWFPALVASHRWFHVTRSIDDSALTTTLHPWESGTDDSPRWLDLLRSITPADLPEFQRVDQELVGAEERPSDLDYERYVHLVNLGRRANWDQRVLMETSPFCVQDVLTNSVLLRADEDLIWLGEQIGEDTSEIEQYRSTAVEAFSDRFWSEDLGLFLDYDVRAQSSIPVNTAMTFLPLWAGVATPEQANSLLAHLRDPNEYWFEQGEGFLVSTTARTEPDWSANRYWRGPIWVLMNWFLHGGLVRYGEKELATRVGHDTVQVIEKGGYGEYFNPYNANPCGASEFSWTAALLLDLLHAGLNDCSNSMD
jgi:glycogen debranching enzyme